jgi:hypothetical protein
MPNNTPLAAALAGRIEEAEQAGRASIMPWRY